MILTMPPGAFCLFVLAHGAGAGMRHPFLKALADALAGERVATLRYDFPYMAEGRRRIDPAEVLHARVREAVAAGAAHGLPLFAGGKSFGGRMTSQAQAAGALSGVLGLCFVGFPLHPAKRPGIERAAHLRQTNLPMLFLQGTRDDLAQLDLLTGVLEELPRATLHVVEDADHSFHVRKPDAVRGPPRHRRDSARDPARGKKSGRTDAQVVVELAQAFARWAQAISGERSSLM